MLATPRFDREENVMELALNRLAACLRLTTTLVLVALASLVASAAPASADFTYYFYGLGGFIGPPPPGGLGANSCVTFCFFSNISPTGKIESNGRIARVSGPIECAAGDVTTLRITVTQRKPVAAIGQVGLKGKCPDGLKEWSYPVPARANHFVSGRAFVCVLGAVEREETYIDARQWCRWITLRA